MYCYMKGINSDPIRSKPKHCAAMQREIKYDDYKRSLAQLDLFNEQLNQVKSKQFEATLAVEQSRKSIIESGVTRILKSRHFKKL